MSIPKYIFSEYFRRDLCGENTTTFALGILGFTSRVFVGAFKKENRPCAQRHTRTDSKSTLPPSAGFTAYATCCLWNASGIISNYQKMSIDISQKV